MAEAATETTTSVAAAQSQVLTKDVRFEIDVDGTLFEMSAPRGDRIDDCASQFIEEHNLPEELQAQLEQAIRFRMVWKNV